MHQCNARVLSTGAILVDFPGSADANAARNAIAKNYMKECNRIWIVAPITRAVDDKTARGKSHELTILLAAFQRPLDLMGDAFKTRMMSKLHATCQWILF